MRWLWTLFLPRAWSQEKRGWTPAYVDAIYAMEGALRRANASDSPTIQRGAWQHDRAVGEHFSSRDAAQAAGQWRALRDAAEALRYPARAFAGAGVAIVGGGLRYYGVAEVNARRLRDVGCTLPIELWCLRAEQPTPALRACRLDPLGVTVRAADPSRALGGGPARRDAFAKRMPATNKRYALKAIALVFCSFEQVLVLDADELAVRDPTFLLQIPGSVTWPDFWASSHSPAFAAAAFGDAKTALFEGTHESGQTVLDKRDAWRSLLPYLFMNLQSTLYYYLTTSGSYGEGDKETLPLALEWATRFLDPPPKWTDVAHKVASVRPNSPTKPEDSANGMIQHDLDGRPLFLHANDPKFSPFDRANGRHNRAPRDWRHWRKGQVAALLVEGGAPNVSLDLETWARDALYDLGCSAAFRYARHARQEAQREMDPGPAADLREPPALQARHPRRVRVRRHDVHARRPRPRRPEARAAGPGRPPPRADAGPRRARAALGDGATRACHAALEEEGAVG
ncbi:mannosyltransferase [Aureococcus anophagefferens]|nr:mannosyltransferase [Aureococcus anophagefferens]